MDIKKAELALLTAFIFFLAPMAVYAGNGVLQDTLGQNEKLKASEELKSKNGKYKIVLQPDGNLVVYESQGKALWNSSTRGSGAIECVMQSDGNLLLRDGNKGVVWATHTNGYPNATLLIQDDGHVVLYKEGGVRVWSNGNINTGIQRETPPADVPAEVSHQNDAGSGRDAGNVLEEAVPIYPLTRPADGELSSTDSIDFYSIPLGKGWKLSLTLVMQSGQDYNVALLDSNGDIQASSARKMGQAEYLEFTPPSSRTYYIRVSRKAGQGHYKIELSFSNQENIKDNLSSYNPNTGDNEYDNGLKNLNNVALADLDDFMNKLSGTFGVSKPWIENLIKRDNIPPADVYMMARTASVTKHPIDTVQKSYLANRGQGWGVIAQHLGIKPGSKEFHALKEDDLGWVSKGKSQGLKKKDNDKS